MRVKLIHNGKGQLQVALLLIFVVFMYFFAPYSVNTSIIVNCVCGVLIIVASFTFGHITKDSFQHFILTEVYVIIVTVVAGLIIPYEKELDLGVMLIFTATCVFCMGKYRLKASLNIYRCVAIFDLIIILWGVAYIFNISAITDWSYNTYAAVGDSFFNRSILLGKPVLSLRFHGQAAYAYINIFFLHYFLMDKKKKKGLSNRILQVTMFILPVFAVCLQANAGYIVAGVMLVFLTIMYYKKWGYRVLLFWVPCLVLIVYFGYTSGLLSEALTHLFTGEKNGFLGRYSGLYEGNFEIMANYFASGMYTISGKTIKADSGLVVTLTRGNIPLVILYYSLIWRFLKKNFYRKNAIIIAGIFLAYEFAYTFLIGRYNGLYWLIIYKICLDSIEVMSNNIMGGKNSASPTCF